jgi:ketosteroid isomerase-like protein
MKRHVTFTVVFVVFGALVSLYLGCTSQPTTNTNSVALASPEPTPDKAAIEADLTRIEMDWPRIIKEKDAAAVRKAEADDVVLVYPDGSMGNKDRDIKDIESGALSFDSWDLSDIVVKVLDNDAAVVTLHATIKGGKYKPADGKAQEISGQYRSVDTFVRRNGQWQMTASATVPILNPTPAASASPAAKASPQLTGTPEKKLSPVTKPSPATKTSPKATTSPM